MAQGFRGIGEQDQLLGLEGAASSPATVSALMLWMTGGWRTLEIMGCACSSRGVESGVDSAHPQPWEHPRPPFRQAPSLPQKPHRPRPEAVKPLTIACTLPDSTIFAHHRLGHR